MAKTPKPKMAYAVVDKRRPIIRVNDIFDNNDIECADNEQIIKVLIIKKENGK